MTRKPNNMAASVRQRLLNMARERGEDYSLLLTQYALERLLYRMSRSEFREHFILKGAMLFSIWGGEPHRPTRDLDLLGSGDNSITHLVKVFKTICQTAVENDGLEFLEETVQGEQIREDQEYEGVRIKLLSRLAGARIPIQVDIGYGDTIIPGPLGADFPTLLDFPAPHLQVYTHETVVAEKFQAIIMLGIANSRMKDFYDLWVITRRFSFEGNILAKAIKATFDRRRTPLPTIAPLAFTPEFFEDPGKKTQWNAFIKRSRLMADRLSLGEVAVELERFFMPPAVASGKGNSFALSWPPAGPWQKIK
jgi:predicted nucleotidyltransferase component of viral defense system